MAGIEKLDKNFAFQTKLDLPDVKWYDAKQEPLQLYGVYKPQEQDYYRRMGETIAEQTNEGVKTLNLQTAGARIRFSTDSDYIALHTVVSEVQHMWNMSPSGSSSFDLYEDCDGHSRYRGTFLAPPTLEKEYEYLLPLNLTKKMRNYTIHFPLYTGVESVYVGVQESATVANGLPYENALPVLYYGSSITQGGCASRPGLAYQSIIARDMNRDFINLGFSGSARAEEIIAEYIAKIPCSAFVYDYDHNAPSLEHLQNTHERMFKTIRAANPDLPIIIVGRPDYWMFSKAFHEGNCKRREVHMTTYLNARAAGDQNVYYVDGMSLFMGEKPDECTVDRCHPNDIGFVRMANAIGCVLNMIFDD